MNLHLEILRLRFLREKQKQAFIKRHRRKILSLSMEGWPRTKQMKDFHKWFELIYEAKVKGIYAFGTSNCDVIAQLERFAKRQNKRK